MANSESRALATGTAFIALGCVGFIASTPALAQESGETARGGKLGGVTVESTAIEDDIKVERAESPRYVRPLLDTPQTITVISNTTLRQQNLLTLRDALSTIPGITFGAGEGGGGYGDSINLRGQSANTDITIDGVRDSAQYSRTDPFNLEQIEVINGANSVYGGSGSIGGTINLVTKRPKADDLTVVQAGIGTDNYYRATVDSNVRVSDLIAVRLNAMYHENDVPGRDVDRYKRWGVAPSVKIGVDGPTSLTLLYVHQKDNNTPLYGVPYYNNALYDGPLPGVSDSSYFGYRNLDYQKQTVDQATMIFEHEFSDRVRVRNLSRWQRVEQNLIVNPPQGTYCLENGLTPTGGACTVDLDTRTGPTQVFNITVPAGYYLPSGPRGNARFSENQALYNQIDVTFNFEGGHTLVVGGSYLKEDYKLDTGNVLRAADGSNPVTFNPAAPNANAHLPYINIGNPNDVIAGPAVPGGLYGSNVYTGPYNFIRTASQDSSLTNLAIYAFTAISFTEQLEFNGGVRYESNKADFRANTISGTTFTPGVPQKSDDNLFSYRAALVFKPVPNASLYVSYANSRNPTTTTVRSGCGLAAAANLLTDPCDLSPEKAVNYEIGGKIDLFAAKLQLTAALFRNERTNFRVASNDPLIGNLPVNDGRSRVDGITLGASGRITDAWTLFANYTYLDTKVKQSISDYCIDNPNSSFTPPGTTTALTCPAFDPQAGSPLTNTPKHSGSLFTTYTFPFGLQIGYGLTYQGSFYLNNARTTATTVLYKADDYLTHRAFASYPVTDKLTAQVNVQNFTNEKYYTGIRNNGWAVPGEDRSAVLSLYYSF